MADYATNGLPEYPLQDYFFGKPKDSREKEDADEAARNFASDQATQAEGILCVFQGLGGAEME